MVQNLSVSVLAGGRALRHDPKAPLRISDRIMLEATLWSAADGSRATDSISYRIMARLGKASSR